MTRSRLRRRLVLAVFVLAVAPTGVATAQEEGVTHPLAARGRQPNRGTFSAAPWESIDMASGNAMLTFPGLTLPGVNGMDFQFVAAANLGGTGLTWSFGLPGPAMIGFLPGVPNPVIVAMDGGQQYTFAVLGGGYRTLTCDELTLTYEGAAVIAATLRRTNGVTYSFQKYASTPLFVTRSQDPYGNGVEYLRDAGGGLTGFVHHVGSQTRTITYTRNATLLTVSWSGAGVPTRVWHYVFGDLGLTEIQPPTGPGWHFDYYTGPYVIRVTTPTGGVVGYQTAMHYGPNSEYPPHQPLYHSLHLMSRTEVASGNMWIFAYVDGQGGEVTSTVTLPDSSGVTTYLHMREPDGVYVGRMYLDHAVTCDKAYGLPDPPPVCAGTTYGWKTLEPVGQELGIDPNGNGEGAYIENPAPQLIAHAFAFRDGRTFATDYHYCGEPGEAPCNAAGHGALNDFGNPASVHETGDFERTTALTYRHAFGEGVYLRGVPVSQAVTVGTETFTTTDTYNDSGFLMARDVFGIVTTYTPTSAGQPASVTDARQFTTALTWDWGVRKQTQTPEYTIQRTINPDGTIQSVTQNGATTTFENDALGRQTRIHPPVGNDTWTTYAEDGTWVRVARGDSWTRTDLDGFGRAVHTENSQGIDTETDYDALGRTARTRAPYNDLHPQERWVEFIYDWLNRVTLKTNPDGSTVAYKYDGASASEWTGLQTTITDENGHTTTQLWHAVGAPGQAWLRAVKDAANETTRYEYNALGSLTKVTSPGGVIRTWSYNTKNQLVWQDQPESGRTEYPEYDNVGNLKKQRDANLHETTYLYDGNNRLTQVTSPPPHESSSTTITYDAANNRKTVANGYVSTTFTYDDANRLTKRTDVVRTDPAGSGRTFVSTFTPDGNGNVVDVQYASSNRVHYGYDSENRITAVSDPARALTFASAISYHPAGGLTGYTSGDGAAHSISYDERQRPDQISASGVANLPALTYGYDDVGNVEAIVDARQGYGATFSYDALDRLKTAGGVWGALEYWYDPLGNRLQKTHNGATTGYGYTSQRLTSTTGAEPASFGYDSNGNQTADPVATYTYTPTNMLETASLVAGAVYTYRYDGDNQRTLKHEGSTRTTYYLRGLGQVLSEFEEQGGVAQWTVDYIYLGSQVLAGVRPAASGTLSVTVEKAGAGTGTVTSGPAGIACGTTCSAAWTPGTVVTLTAAPDPGWVFVGWSGEPDCADGVVTLTAAKTCVATFAAFTKRTPASGSVGLGTSVALTWSPVAGAAYEVCVDSTDDRACATGWQAAGAATTLTVGGLSSQTTYFWQVRTVGASSQEADVGTWSSFTVDQPAPRRHWYLAEGTTVWAFGFQEDLLVFNPTTASTHVDIQYLKPNGTVVLQDFDLGPKTRRAVRVNTVVQGTDVAAVVESSTQDVVVERTMTWSSGRGGHHGAGVTAPALDWYLAEGTTYGDFATFLTIANPGTAATDVQVTCTPDTGTAVTQTYTVGAQSRLTIYANGIVGAGRNFWTRVHSLGTGVVVERSMYWGSDFEGGHETAASPVRAPEWRFAEGATGTGFGFSTYLLIANPDATATAAVQVRFVKGDGTTVTQSYQIQPLRRQTILVNDVPGMGWAPGFSTIVRSVNGVGVVAERVMYWGNWMEGHVTVGAPARSVAWWCGEGRQGTQDGLTYDTYIPLLNEDPEQALTVRAEFALETGTTIVRTYTVQPGRRFTIWTGDVAELVGQKFAVTLEGTTADGVTPLAFVAERVTYWGDGWYGGHGSLGVARR